jgi:hypothetical protein
VQRYAAKSTRMVVGLRRRNRSPGHADNYRLVNLLLLFNDVFTFRSDSKTRRPASHVMFASWRQLYHKLQRRIVLIRRDKTRPSDYKRPFSAALSWASSPAPGNALRCHAVPLAVHNVRLIAPSGLRWFLTVREAKLILQKHVVPRKLEALGP